MSTDPKPPKPMPSADEINAYLELSAARTKLRLPLAKGAARADTLPKANQPAIEKNEKRSPLISGSKKLPTRQEEAGGAAPGAAGNDETGTSEVWRPFPNDEER
jgi:hypothetical protein